MAPHSSTLAWKIPWTEEPGWLQSMGSHRVRHDWSNLTQYSNPISTNCTLASWHKMKTWLLQYLADLNSTDQDLFINPAYEIHLRNSAVNVQPPRSEIHLVHCGLWTSLWVKSPPDKSGILWHPGLSGLRLEESLNRGRCSMSIYLVKQIKYFPNPQWTEAKVTFTLFCST